MGRMCAQYAQIRHVNRRYDPAKFTIGPRSPFACGKGTVDEEDGVHSRMIKLFVVVAVLILVPAASWGQSVGFTGRVTDETGGVLPGVTVEVRSPVMIEQVRTAFTDGEGLFTIIDLRPGDYSVTFLLPGFQTLVRDGIQLSGAAVATVNAQLSVGALEETITVTGDSPDVDIRNVVQETALDTEIRNALPTGRSLTQMAELIPGVTVSVGHDVGGTELNRGASMIHGSRAQDYTMQFDGTRTARGGSGTNGVRNIDPGEVAEFQYETSAISAETSQGGVRANMIPKEGGNTFSGSFFTTYSNNSFQSDNTTQELIDAGLPEASKLTQIRDLNLSAGGPIVDDRLWYFASTRLEGAEKEVAGNFYAIDPLAYVWNPRLGAAGNVDESRPGIDDLNHVMYSTRLTFQATPRNKLSLYLSNHSWSQPGLSATATISIDGAWTSDVPWGRLFQAKWTSPVTDRVLIQASHGDAYNDSILNATRPGLERTDILGVFDVGTGTWFRANTRAGYGSTSSWQPQTVFSVSYVTGSHNFKVGTNLDWGWQAWRSRGFNGNVRLWLNNGTPFRITAENGLWTDRESFRKVGLYAQDQWTLDRITINAGIRYDSHVGGIVEGQNFSGPGRFAPYQEWPAIDNVPNWKDISPRLGVVYDLTGDGNTALKFSASKYVVNEGIEFATSVNPLKFNFQETRAWTDTNGDYFPDDDELGPGSNANFATPVTNITADDAIGQGWGVRQHNWEFTGGVQHQLMQGLSIEVLYAQRLYRNFIVDDLLDVRPEHYSEYCVTAPTDTRLGGASGSEVCGLYDINPAQRPLQRTLRTLDTNFGTQKESWQGMDANVSFRRGIAVVSGGISSGTQGNRLDDCFIVDSPQQMYQCEVNPPWQNTVKLLASFSLPYGVDLAATYQGIPGPEILANWTVTNRSHVADGLVRFVDPSRTAFSGASNEISLLNPGTVYGERLHQVDIRASKAFNIGSGFQARVTVDIANLLNENTVLGQSNTYGPNWLRPNSILFGRIIKPGLLLEW